MIAGGFEFGNSIFIVGTKKDIDMLMLLRSRTVMRCLFLSRSH